MLDSMDIGGNGAEASGNAPALLAGLVGVFRKEDECLHILSYNPPPLFLPFPISGKSYLGKKERIKGKRELLMWHTLTW